VSKLKRASGSQLDEFRQEVNWNLACGALADVQLPVVGVDGNYPVVVALEDEPLSIVLGRLRAVGGFANLFVRGAHRVRAASVIDKRSAIIDDGEDMCAEGEHPGPTATVGMFLDYLAQCPRGIVLSIVSGDADRPALATDARTVEFAGLAG
jgi:hypothetical protein